MATSLSALRGLKALELPVSVPMHGMAAQLSIRQMALSLGFSGDASEEITLAVAELTSNLIKHAGKAPLRPGQSARVSGSGLRLKPPITGRESATSRSRLKTATRPQAASATAWERSIA